ncbi:hypothetical protein [Yoonia sp. 208BN28-4]|uniref:hypothetical protein n=1 Tax=Yoonia sp. 208BN28-4 TaxID=3126505 RepID=UPI00309FA39E
MSVDRHRDELVLSYTRVRTALGVLGMMLPLVLILGGVLDAPRVGAETGGIEPTISDFYHTTYRDVFVGTLCAIGVFLISYRGYRREPGEVIDDDWLATIAGLSAFGVAFFPNEGGGEVISSMTQYNIGVHITPTLHYLSALIFFSCLMIFCFYKFARTARPARRRIYMACGWIIVFALVATAVSVVFKRFIGGAGRELVLDYNLIFWFEAIGIWAFGLSWLVKGKADLALARAVSRKPPENAVRSTLDDEDIVQN